MECFLSLHTRKTKERKLFKVLEHERIEILFGVLNTKTKCLYFYIRVLRRSFTLLSTRKMESDLMEGSYGVGGQVETFRNLKMSVFCFYLVMKV